MKENENVSQHIPHVCLMMDLYSEVVISTEENS